MEMERKFQFCSAIFLRNRGAIIVSVNTAKCKCFRAHSGKLTIYFLEGTFRKSTRGSTSFEESREAKNGATVARIFNHRKHQSLSCKNWKVQRRHFTYEQNRHPSPNSHHCRIPKRCICPFWWYSRTEGWAWSGLNWIEIWIEALVWEFTDGWKRCRGRKRGREGENMEVLKYPSFHLTTSRLQIYPERLFQRPTSPMLRTYCIALFSESNIGWAAREFEFPILESGDDAENVGWSIMAHHWQLGRDWKHLLARRMNHGTLLTILRQIA